MAYSEKKAFPILLALSLFFVFSFAAPDSAFAGKLGDFERDVSGEGEKKDKGKGNDKGNNKGKGKGNDKGKSKGKGKLRGFEGDGHDKGKGKGHDEHGRGHGYGHDKDRDYDDDVDGSIFFFIGTVYGGMVSWDRVAGTGEEAKPRENGETLVPYFNLNTSYHWVDPDITAIDLRGELGYGPFALELRRTTFEEDFGAGSLVELKVDQTYFLYRMSFGSSFELDMGFGSMKIAGVSSNSGFSFALPMKLRVSDNITLELRSAWATVGSSDISDYDATIYLTFPYVAINAGYRWLSSDNVMLDGPKVGLSLFW